MLEIVVVFLVVVCLILAYVVWNLNRKCIIQEQVLEDYLVYLDKISKVIEASDLQIKDLDRRGIFSSDDEIGFFFVTVKDIQEVLNNFILREVKE